MGRSITTDGRNEIMTLNQIASDLSRLGRPRCANEFMRQVNGLQRPSNIRLPALDSSSSGNWIQDEADTFGPKHEPFR